MSWKFWKKKKLLVTHSGSFHADDIFAAATLTLWLDQCGEPYRILRSRKSEDFACADYVFDVGGVYDHAIARYDHHQPEGAGEHKNGIPYAAFGLVWKHYGPDVCDGDMDVWQAVNTRLVQAIDASDNGVDLYRLNEYGVQPVRIQEIIKLLPGAQQEDKDTRFKTLVTDFARGYLSNLIAKEKERVEIERDLLAEVQGQAGQAILTLEGNYGRDVIWNTLVPRADMTDLLYVVYSHDKYRDESWNIVGMLKELHQKGTRMSFPQAWCGLEKEELSRLSGVEGMNFCHRTGFLAGAATKGAAIAFAQKALEVNQR